MTDSPLSWQSPPAPIAQILAAPPSPSAYLSPTGQWLLELEHATLCPIADLMEPELGLAGFRLNPQTFGPARPTPYHRMVIQEIATGQRQPVDLPPEARISFIRWSPDGVHVAFVLTQATGLELWVMPLATGKPWRVTEPILNGTYGVPYRWQSPETFLCKVVPSDRSGPPVAPIVPPGPRVQENLGRKTPARTYTHLLTSPQDEALFEYYITSSLEQVTLTGQRSPLAAPGLMSEAIPSPDGQYILLSWVQRPFSYQVPESRFPRLLQVLDAEGTVLHTVAELGLDDQRSIKFDAVRPGRRGVGWRSDRPATLYWVEALDGGDPQQTVPHRDRVMQQAAPFTEEPEELWRSQHRFQRLTWGRADVALAWERDYDSRQLRMWRIHPDAPSTPPTLLLERSTEDHYSAPGSPLTVAGPFHWEVLRFTPDGTGLYFSGRGASPEGVYPFLEVMDLATGDRQRLWQCQAPYFEGVVDIVDGVARADGEDDLLQLLTRRQSQSEPPNYWLRSLVVASNTNPSPSADTASGADSETRLLTDYGDPAPHFAGVHKELVQYPRADGVMLSANLYWPAGYEPERDGPLPMVFWVYPAEFKNRDLAGQVTTAEHAFSRPSRASVLFLLTQGYAVLDDPTLPIIGEGEAEPNDTYVEQLVAGAEAAVNYVVERGVGDRDRLGIGGHSYGAFTTANLLAHTDLFKLGIARSGAYNRTLTPFGFQGEQRNFWQAPETYNHMAPFTHAAKITAPLLLIHGASDSNAGTYPVQTERLYEALKGLGATVRWVELPLEDHGYRSQEAVGHVLWEMVRWCDLYLKAHQGKEAA